MGQLSARQPHHPRDYVDKWMTVYAGLVLDADVPDDFCNAITRTDATAGDPLNPLVDDQGRAWSIPVPPSAFNPSQLDDPHYDYPAWDLMIPTGTPVHALTAGTVARCSPHDRADMLGYPPSGSRSDRWHIEEVARIRDAHRGATVPLNRHHHRRPRYPSIAGIIPSRRVRVRWVMA